MKFLLPLVLCTIFVSPTLSGQCDCDPIIVQTPVTVVRSVIELQDAFRAANTNNGNMTIEIQPGTYNLTSNLRFISENMSNLTIIGSTGDRDDVIITGPRWDDNSVTHIFNVAADNVTIADMTIGGVFYHPIQVHSNPSDADNFLVQNVRFIDAKEQLLKVSGGGDLFADNGRVLCCSFEFTSGIAYQYYTGGIDAHRAVDWQISNNFFDGIRSPETLLAEHAIHMWQECSGTIIENNHIINCDRGIGFGLGPDQEDNHEGGIIKNNFVHTNRDVGIGLEASPDAKVYNNTVITENYSNSIEYRFPSTTNADIRNNLVSHNIASRSDGVAMALENNYTITELSVFHDASAYDYHLKEDAIGIIDAGQDLDEVTEDIDCRPRSMGTATDIGADEFEVVSSNTTPSDLTVKIFPNPATDYFIIEGASSLYKVTVTNSKGTIINSMQMTSGASKLDCSDLSPGVYFVKVHEIESDRSNVVKLFKL